MLIQDLLVWCMTCHLQPRVKIDPETQWQSCGRVPQAGCGLSIVGIASAPGDLQNSSLGYKNASVGFPGGCSLNAPGWQGSHFRLFEDFQNWNWTPCIREASAYLIQHRDAGNARVMARYGMTASSS